MSNFAFRAAEFPAVHEAALSAERQAAGIRRRLPEVKVVVLFVTAITFVPVLLAYRLMQRSG